MSYTTFTVSTDVPTPQVLHRVDFSKELRTAFRRPIEQIWVPQNPVVNCNEEHALLGAAKIAFFRHLPLKLSPDTVWITLARGFALHINLHAELFRDRFVQHSGKEKLVVTRPDFLPGQNNPWSEVFNEFSMALSQRTGGLSSLVEADFSTTGPIERSVSHLMAMETMKAYFDYEMMAGCGIPSITLTGTHDDWVQLRAKVQHFADYGLENWISALDPVLRQFELAKIGRADRDFWRSMFRYNSGSGISIMTGWINTLFPYFLDRLGRLYPNPCLKDWEHRFKLHERQTELEQRTAPQGVSASEIPPCHTSIPLNVHWGEQETLMRLVGGLMAVSQHEESLAVEVECGWIVMYEEPVDPLSRIHERIERWKSQADMPG